MQGFMYTAVLSKELDVLCPDAFPMNSSKIRGGRPTPKHNPKPALVLAPSSVCCDHAPGD